MKSLGTFQAIWLTSQTCRTPGGTLFRLLITDQRLATLHILFFHKRPLHPHQTLPPALLTVFRTVASDTPMSAHIDVRSAAAATFLNS